MLRSGGVPAWLQLLGAPGNRRCANGKAFGQLRPAAEGQRRRGGEELHWSTTVLGEPIKCFPEVSGQAARHHYNRKRISFSTRQICYPDKFYVACFAPSSEVLRD
jgi:hypothetical protein